MRSAKCFTAVLCLIIALSWITTTPVRAANVQLSGTVTDQANNPQVGATVAVLTPGGGSTVASTMTDMSGNYVLSFPAGTYDVTATPPAGSIFHAVTRTNQSITSDTSLNFIFVASSGTITVSGVIRDGTGAALTGLNVSLGSGSASTDGSGHYSVQVAPGTYSLSANIGSSSAPHTPFAYFFSSDPISLTQDTVLPDFILTFKQVSVHVQDASGNGVANTSVSANSHISSAPLPTGGQGWSDAQATTDISGNATLWLFPHLSGPPYYDFYATPPTGGNVSPTSVTNIVIPGDTSLTITLPTLITVSGVIRDGTGAALTGLNVSLGSSSGSTDGSGHYAVRVMPGTYSLGAGLGGSSALHTPSSGYYFASDPISLTQDTVLPDFILTFKQVSVHVQDASGNGVANTSVSASSMIASAPLPTGGRGWSDAQATTDISGNATLWLFPRTNPYSYSFRATPPTGGNVSPTSVTNIVVPGDTSLTITLPTLITVSGVIRDGTGTALTGLYVGIGSGLTDSMGHYSVRVAPGMYALGAGNGSSSAPHTPLAYSFTSDPISLTQDTVLPDFILTFKQVNINVQDASGNGVANTSVRVASNITSAPLPSGGRGWSDAQATTDTSGNATLWLFPNTSDNPYSFTVTPPPALNTFGVSLKGVVITTDTSEYIFLDQNARSGSSGGGDTATFTVPSLPAGTQVFFGDTPATVVNVTPAAVSASRPRTSPVLASRITVITPAHAPGTVDVRIIPPNQPQITLTGAYKYVTVNTAPVTHPQGVMNPVPPMPGPMLHPAAPPGVAPQPTPTPNPHPARH